MTKKPAEKKNRTWAVSLIRKHGQFLGYVEASDRDTAEAAAVVAVVIRPSSLWKKLRKPSSIPRLLVCSASRAAGPPIERAVFAPDVGIGLKAAVRASSADRPVWPPLQTSDCAAVNRRCGPMADSCSSKTKSARRTPKRRRYFSSLR
jgi:hypothetical protein